MHQDHPNQIDLHGRPCGPIGTGQPRLFDTAPATAPTPTPAPADPADARIARLFPVRHTPELFPTPAGTVPTR